MGFLNFYLSQDQVSNYSNNMVQGMLLLLKNCPQVRATWNPLPITYHSPSLPLSISSFPLHLSLPSSVSYFPLSLSPSSLLPPSLFPSLPLSIQEVAHLRRELLIAARHILATDMRNSEQKT